MSKVNPPSPPHSTEGDRNKDRGQQHSLPDPFTPPLAMAAPMTRSEYVSLLEGLLFDLNLPMQDQYGDPSLYHTPAQRAYYDQQYGPYYPPPPRDYTPTPPPAGYLDSGIHTRSGRALHSPETPKRTIRDLPTKRAPKRARAKAGKAGAPVLEASLSELTKDYSLPIRDMEAWVTRSSEDRRKESEKKNGYISRPMNSFMLYRSAYAERVKQFCKENNHQVVSQVTGASWPMEPDSIRKLYERYAIIERDNHQLAFPGYKFAPNKNGKKRAREEDEDSDGEWGGSSRTKRSRTAASSMRGDTPRSRTGTPFDDYDYHTPSPYQQYQPQMAYNPSAYDYHYPQGPVPVYPNQYAPQRGEYYQQKVTQYAPQIEDVRFSQHENAFPAQDQMLNLVAMPGVDDQHLLSQTDASGNKLVVHGDMLDPRLGDAYQLPEFGGFDPSFISPQQAGFATEAFHPGEQMLTQAPNPFAEPGPNDFDRELGRF